MNSNLKKLAFVPALLLAFAPSFASAQEMKNMDMTNITTVQIS
jgi:hypothetical protein